MTEQLKPCPFCGDAAWMKKHGGIFGGDIGYRVECEGRCHAMTCYWHTEAQAVDAWNTRAEDTQLSTLQQRLDAITKPRIYTGRHYSTAEIPDRCPDCDGRDFTSHGPDRMICHQCWLTSELDRSEQEVKALQQRHEGAVKAVKGLLDQIEAGNLVRDTRGDGEPGWAIKQMPLVIALQHARAALSSALPDTEGKND
jgi:Lar family restriction alleviation protein